MDENIINHFQMKLLQNPIRMMNENGQIIEIYNQPERLNETASKEEAIVRTQQ